MFHYDNIDDRRDRIFGHLFCSDGYLTAVLMIVRCRPVPIRGNRTKGGKSSGTPADLGRVDGGDLAVDAGREPSKVNATDSSSGVLTVAELAALLRTSKRTAYAAIARGDVPGVRRVGKQLRVHRGAVLAWLAAGGGQ